MDVGRTGRRRALWLVLVTGVVLVGFVLFWFQPQKLLIDERVRDPAPVTAAPRLSTTDGDDATAAPAVAAAGTFVSRDHRTSGTVRVLELADGSRVVRLEGLNTDNGPDLFLYLSTNPANGEESAFDDKYLNLGRLQGNLGDQNYDVPPGVDLTRYASVVIWCDRFDSAFGAADLV